MKTFVGYTKEQDKNIRRYLAALRAKRQAEQKALILERHTKKGAV